MKAIKIALLLIAGALFLYQNPLMLIKASNPEPTDLITRYELESYFAAQDERREQTINKAIESTVLIKVSKDGNGYQGTGFFISPSTILTNKHVVDGYEITSIKTQTGTMCIPRSITKDSLNDLAFIQTDCNEPYLKADYTPRAGQDVYAIGNPVNYDFSVSKGIVSAFRGPWVQFDAYINSGNSGGPLINSKGEAIGVVTLVSKSQKGAAFALSISAAKIEIEKALRNDRGSV